MTHSLTPNPSCPDFSRPSLSLAPYQAQRIWYKLATKYGGDVSKVTDCARISLEFTTAEALEKAAQFMLQGKASSFKNRMANPTAEGYRDLLFKVLIGGHVCEVPPPPPPAPTLSARPGPAACGTAASSWERCGGRMRGVGVGLVLLEAWGQGACACVPRRSHAVRAHVARRCSSIWWR